MGVPSRGFLGFTMEQRDTPKGQEKQPDDAREAAVGADRGQRRIALRGWLIVCAIAILFTLYGFFAFFIIGDKGRPDWDYGSLPDVPAQSEYSTYPYGGGPMRPEPQHVNQKPPEAESGIPAGEIPLVPQDGPGKEVVR
jgi:hypothetical protein